MEKLVRIVEAIDDGKIVRVSEEYAQREGLPILRRPEMMQPKALAPSQQPAEIKEKSRRGILGFDEYRKPLRPGKNNVQADLQHNFHWVLQQKRRQRGVSRKQVASSLSVNENDLKLLENGVLPRDDYVLISKLEGYYGISLRTSAPVSAPTLRELKKPETAKPVAEKPAEVIEEVELLGSDIELDEGNSKAL